SLKERLRSRFNVSVSETGHQDAWTRAEVTVAVVAGDRRFADSVLDRVDRFVELDGRAIIAGTTRELR
ncbi:MAG TPA: DUF503 domain-containing protein, partial [Longimicrobiales bacterium]|nr:DUF503 domain-containing protein [Longimicrobiales bacterium]